MSTLQWWGYLHTSGSIHTKRYLGDPMDLVEARESPFVKDFLDVFEADSGEAAREIVREHFQ